VDYGSTMQKVARLAVPSFADWCAVDLLEPDGSLRRVAVAHVDPFKVELAHALHRRYPPDPDAPQGVRHILRTGRPELISEVTDALLVETVKDAELLRRVRELGLKSYLGVPLQARGKTVGAVTFVAAESGRRFDATDLAVAEDLAHRAGIAMENARLYGEVREADRRKDEFLAMLAHELRNPLAPIRNGLHIMKQAGTDTAVLGRVREMIERQVQHMTRMVDDLLDVSRITRGKIELRKEAVDLASVVERTAEATRPLIEDRIRFRCRTRTRFFGFFGRGRGLRRGPGARRQPRADPAAGAAQGGVWARRRCRARGYGDDAARGLDDRSAACRTAISRKRETG
jgi:signal transduction histidine kinase